MGLLTDQQIVPLIIEHVQTNCFVVSSIVALRVVLFISVVVSSVIVSLYFVVVILKKRKKVFVMQKKMSSSSFHIVSNRGNEDPKMLVHSPRV